MTTLTHPGAREWLASAATWRCFSLCFRLPTEESRAGLIALGPELTEELRELVSALAEVPLDAWEEEYHRVLGPGCIPACESSYDDNALAGRGPLLADVRGFYEAFAYQPPELPAELPDHLAVQLDFLSFLAVKCAFALHEGREAEARIAQEAYEKFAAQHLRNWLPRFHDALNRSASSLYLGVSSSLCRCALDSPDAT